MITQFTSLTRFRKVCFSAGIIAAGILALAATANRAAAQGLGYGVSSDGVSATLFRFDLSDPDLSDAGSATTIGVLPGNVIPEGIDFRPTTTAGDPNRPLYAIDVGPVTTQLYTVNTKTAALTPVGAGFPSVVVASYDLVTGNQKFGFDFNPATQQADGSIRIRLVSTGGANLRLNSDTGLVAAVDSPLTIGTAAPFVDAIAYINSNKAVIGGTTTLFDMDSRNNSLYTQNPPNNGTLNLVGPFGAPGSFFADSGIGFDVLTNKNDADTGIGGDKAYAVLTRDGPYRLYKVNLTTGELTAGVNVDVNRNFTGGLALTYTPEPATLFSGVCGALALVGVARRRTAS